jgi:integrase
VVWTKYLAYAKLNKVTWRDDLTRWKYHVEPQLNLNTPMNRITPSDINKVLDNMRNTHAPATVRQVLTLIKRVYNWSIKQGLYLGMNPCNRVESPKFDNRLTDTLSEDGLTKFIELVNNHQNIRFQLVVKFALFTGKRRGEILKLTWDSVDLVNGLVTYQGTTTKNGVGHTLPVNRNAQEVLTNALELKISDLVFPNGTGNYFVNFDKIWQTFKRKHDIKIRFHGLDIPLQLCWQAQVKLIYTPSRNYLDIKI